MKERLMFQNAPHVRQSESVVTMMSDVIIALLPIYFMAFFYHGARSLVLGLFGVIFCCALSLLGSILLHEKPIPDFTPIITGLMIPLLLPADIPYYVLFSACVVAIFVVKVPFGGTGYNLFNPAAVGFASVAICWPDLVFRYPVTMQPLEIFGESAVKLAQGPAYSLSLGAVPDYNILDMLLGSAPGPMGATNILVVAACGIFLIVKKAVNWITPFAFFVPYSALCMLFPRISVTGFESLCYELFSGAIVFGAFFMLTDPVTSPKRDFGKLMAGIFSAVAVFLFRYFGGFEMGFASALIVMNVFSPIFDTVCEKVLHAYRHRKSLFAKIKDSAKPAPKKEEEKPVVRVIEKTEEPEVIEEISEETPEKTEEEVSEETPEEIPEEIDLSEDTEEKEEEEAVQL